MLPVYPVNRYNPDYTERLLALVGNADCRYILISKFFAPDRVLMGFSWLELSKGKHEYG